VDDGERLVLAASVFLPAEPRSAARAREFIAEFCTASRLPPDVCETAALLVSELVTNAVIHGRTSATIDVRQPGDFVRVSVHDDNPALPVASGHADVTHESGRGLTIVSELADTWGIETRDGGKAVWFELHLR
jgi:anti-sigma regulatory factor (Ser/Thr protein kinase)